MIVPFLPATKATPKEMLPVVDKPAIQYVVEEAAAAGLDDVLMVTGRHERAIEDHFDHAFELEQALAAKGTRRHVGDQPFAVLLGDDLIDPREILLSWMLDVCVEVPREQIHRYGCAAVEPTGEDEVVRVTGLVEKPSPRDAPSAYAVIGRHVLDLAVFHALERTPPS